MQHEIDIYAILIGQAIITKTYFINVSKGKYDEINDIESSMKYYFVCDLHESVKCHI